METLKPIHLDTSFLIRAQVPDTPERSLLRAWLCERRPLAISAVAWTEYLFGPVTPEMAETARAIVGQAKPFTSDDAAKAAALFNSSGRRRGSIADCMIAAAALRDRASLATSNPKDFARFADAGLTILPTA